MDEAQEIRPQQGRQEAFCGTSADIAIYGGAAGGGKSWALCFEAARHHYVENYSGIIFRRKSTEIRGGGGLWDESVNLYMNLGGVPNESRMEWKFPGGGKIQFSHMEHEKNKFDHKGRQYPFIGFDELTDFSEGQFWYLVSRNRTTCGVRPYVRGTTNPDPDSWVRRFIAWWIDEEGFAIEERAGQLRWFVRNGDDIVWEHPIVLKQMFPEQEPTSVTFVPAKLTDNPILVQSDPQYKTRLMSLPRVERERLLQGNWNIRPSAGDYFRRSWFEVVDEPPRYSVAKCRAWDFAATRPSSENSDPDWTVGVKMSLDKEGVLYIEHVERFRDGPAEVEKAVLNCAKSDGKSCHVALWQDPGQAGKREKMHMTKMLMGFIVSYEVAKKDKETYAKPVSGFAEAGNIKLVRGPWNDAFISELEAFPSGSKKDQVDALSRGFMLCTNSNSARLDRLVAL